MAWYDVDSRRRVGGRGGTFGHVRTRHISRVRDRTSPQTNKFYVRPSDTGGGGGASGLSETRVVQPLKKRPGPEGPSIPM